MKLDEILQALVNELQEHQQELDGTEWKIARDKAFVKAELAILNYVQERL